MTRKQMLIARAMDAIRRSEERLTYEEKVEVNRLRRAVRLLSDHLSCDVITGSLVLLARTGRLGQHSYQTYVGHTKDKKRLVDQVG